MSEPYFFLAAIPPAGADTLLSAEESRHAAGVRRLRAGDKVRVFDGNGTVATAIIAGDARRELKVTIADRVQLAMPSTRVHLACAVPKGDRMATLLDMATQLGMSAFTPLMCARSMVTASEHAMERWQRICLEACKQSRRAYLPSLRMPTEFAAAVRAAARDRHRLYIAHPGGTAPGAQGESGDITLLVGPEGGFTDDEVALALEAGAQAVDLGEGILRTETAAIALLAIARRLGNVARVL